MNAIKGKLNAKQGFSALEILVVVGIVSIMGYLAAPKLLEMFESTSAAAYTVREHLQEVRSLAQADATTYQITPTSSTVLAVTYSTACSDTTRTTDADLALTLSSGTMSTGWTACFNQRGHADDDIEITVTEDSVSKTIEVLLSGAIREL